MTKMVTEKEMMELKRKAEEGKQTLLRAQATLEEVNRNILLLHQDLEEIGVDPATAEEYLANLESKIKELYQKALDLLPE